MTQEEKSLLLKDLCARLPYGIIIHLVETDEDEELYCLNIPQEGLYTRSLKHNNVTTLAPIEDIKPYLRPLSSMTEEERDEVEEISHGWFYINEDGEIFPTGRLTDSGEFEDAILPTFEYFLKTHIDYRGLIEKGLALVAPEGMYEY